MIYDILCNVSREKKLPPNWQKGFLIMVKLDKRRKYYLILDCETATLPYASNYAKEPEKKKKIAIAKPLIYDLGWSIVDRKGNVYRRKNFLITEIFSVPSVFNTAYFSNKRPIYLEKLRKGEITLTDWNSAIEELENDLAVVESVGAYNSMFDYKKAIPFTEEYIKNLYSSDYQKWEEFQNAVCENIANGETYENKKDFDGENFILRDKTYPLFDIWGLACRYLLNNDDYKQMCLDNEWKTASGKYFSTTAEIAFRYLTKNMEFIESHTAIDDVDIESQIFAKIIEKKLSNLEIGLIYFPFRELGSVTQFEIQKELNGEW
jgi:hypothetical protein